MGLLKRRGFLFTSIILVSALVVALSIAGLPGGVSAAETPVMDGAMPGGAPEANWMRTFDRGYDETNGFLDCAVDSNGDIVAVGSSDDNTGASDALMLKYNASGDVVWEVILDEGNEELFFGVAFDNDDNIYATGFSEDATGTRDVMTVGFDPEGDMLPGWPKYYDREGDDDSGLDLLVNSDGDLVLTGVTTSATNDPSLLLHKYEVDGTPVPGWPKVYTTGDGCVGYSIAQDYSGRYFTGGLRQLPGGGVEAILCRFSSQGDIITGWPKIYACESGGNASIWTAIGLDGDNNVICGGLSQAAGVAPERIYGRYSIDGELLGDVTRIPGGTLVGMETPPRIAVTNSGCVLSNGSSFDPDTGEIGFELLKLEPDGTQVPGWPWEYSDADFNIGGGVAIGLSGEVYGCGYSQDPAGTLSKAVIFRVNDAPTWYLAEGSTGSDLTGSFETWVLVQNPGEEPARAQLTYQTPDGKVAGPELELEPGTRQTVSVADTVPDQWDVSTMVASDVPVVAERAVYWNPVGEPARYAATDSIGAVSPSRTWFLAEGSTGQEDRGSFETWVLLQNPGTAVASAQLTYQTPEGEVEGPEVTLEPGTRQSVSIANTLENEWSVSTRVDSDLPIVCERAVYWNPTGGVFRKSATDSIGATAPARDWYLAEGSTGQSAEGGFSTWVLVQNPGSETANVELRFQTPTGEHGPVTFQLVPGTRWSYEVASFVTNEWSVSTYVRSDHPVVCERSVYWNDAVMGFRQVATDSIGAVSPGEQWDLAEGSTGSNDTGFFETYILVQNPGTETATAQLTYQTPTGEVEGPELVLAPGTRQTVNVADRVSDQWSVSTRVTSDRPVVCERSVYWNSGGCRLSGHDSIGYDP